MVIKMEWRDSYPQTKKPSYQELLDYFFPLIRDLFVRFDDEMQKRFNVHNKYHKYLKTQGWTYGYGRNYNCELLKVAIQSDSFLVLGVTVEDEASLQRALDEAKRVYDNGFEARYADLCEKRRRNQIERAKNRTAREKTELSALLETVESTKLNQFRWCKKVSRRDLQRLYQSEANGMIDDALLDEIGYAFYARCRQSKEILPLLEQGQIQCHHCGSVLYATGYASITQCECGYCYTYREYRRSFNANDMPAHRAQPIFDAFMEKWPQCKEPTQKMMLIDWLIHAFHVTLMSGEKGRSVCVNLIEGTKKQISDLILTLAYDSGV